MAPVAEVPALDRMKRGDDGIRSLLVFEKMMEPFDSECGPWICSFGVV